jgi:hypothetical protein
MSVNITTLKEILASIDKLPPEYRQQVAKHVGAETIDKLSASAENVRLKRLQAARTNPNYETAVRTANRYLRALDLDIDKIAASGDAKELEAAFVKNKTESSQRMIIKTLLANIGVIR